MIHQALLRQSVQGRDPILLEFVDTLAPKVLEYCAAIPALGGSGAPRSFPDLEIPDGLRSYTPEELKLFGESNPDQSMATHLLNGVFAAMPLANRLPPNKQLTHEEKRLWILGYLMHDYTKIYGLNVPAGKLDEIRQLVNQLGERFEFEKFFPAWKDYLDDIVWLAQNIQTRVGANLNERDFNLKTDPRRLFNLLRMLGSIVDVLVHVKSPSEVLLPSPERATDSNLREKIKDLFGAEDAPRLTYHKLTEVRGLLSNLINNAVMDSLAEQGCEPYLFFPNGVVYLTKDQKAIQVSLNNILSRVWDNLIELLAGGVPNEDEADVFDDEGFQLTKDRMKGTLKLPPVLMALYEYDADRLLRLGISAAKRLAPESAQNRLTKIGKGDLGLIADRRVNQLAMFLHYVDVVLTKKLYPKAKGITEALLDALDLTEKITIEDVKKKEHNLGGSPYGWFYAAAIHISQPERRGMSPEELDEFIASIPEKIVKLLEQQQITTFKESAQKSAMEKYISSTLEVDGHNANGNEFLGEFHSYMRSKDKRKFQCSLCSSSFESNEQTEDIVLFLAQQYSNKNPLGGSVKRGICPICMLEMMLRQVQQHVPKKTFQKDKPIYLWIYPTYFFTLETANFVKKYITDTQNLSLHRLFKHLRENGFTVANLLDFKGFLKYEDEEEDYNERNIFRPEYSEHYEAGLFNFALRPWKKKPTDEPSDTDAWVMPTLYALSLPLLLGVKIVATTSFVPLYSSGADYKETTILDAPHQFTRYIFGKDHFRVDEISLHLLKLIHLYDLHLDVYQDGFDPRWSIMNSVVTDVFTDPLSVFSYYDRKKRGGEDEKKGKGGISKKKKGGSKSNQIVSISDINRYYQIYLTLGGEANMGVIGKLVDAYAAFYGTRGYNPSAYAIVRPFDELINNTLKSKPNLERDDLALWLSGTLADVMERVWDNNIKDASDPIIFEKNSPRKMEERKMLSRQKQEEFVDLFLKELFEGLCQGRRATLQENANRYRSAAKFYYLKNYYYSNKPEANNE